MVVVAGVPSLVAVVFVAAATGPAAYLVTKRLT